MRIENQSRELILIFHSEKVDDKRARGYVESLPTLVVRTLDLANESITEVQLAQLADKLEVDIEGLIDPVYDKRPKDLKAKHELNELDRQKMLTFIRHNPILLSTPILIMGDRAYKYSSDYQLTRGYHTRD